MGKPVNTRVVLFSRDTALARSCREVLAEIFGTDWRLVTGAPGQRFSEDDLCIWDLDPGEIRLPQSLDRAKLKKHFFLLHKKSLAAFQALAGTSGLNVLLKPVTRATLRAFLGEAGRERDLRAEPERAGALRAERDDILQFLIHANLKLQEYDQDRTNFLARSVHDFRAPLTAITGYCGMLLAEELGPLAADQREILERMQRSAVRLSRISEAMFQLSIAQNVDQKPNIEKADIRDCVDQALHELAPNLENKRISVTVEIEPPADGLLFEKTQMEQTLINLLENACKFTPRAGNIDIRGYPFFWNRRVARAAPLDPSRDRRVSQVNAPNAFRIDIHDSGPGIPMAHADKIFEEYTSYSGGQDRSGGGLGLAICRMILHQHQGRIWAESSPAGAKFSFVLPLRPNGACPPAGRDGSETGRFARLVEG